MVRAAELHYHEHKSDHEIAAELGVTTQRAAGLIDEARAQGIVRIEIVHPRARRATVESRLRERFALVDAVVLPVIADEYELCGRVASAAAEYLVALAPPPAVLGVGWGHAIDTVAERLPDSWGAGATVVQLNGAMSANGHADGASDAAKIDAAKIDAVKIAAVKIFARKAGGAASLLTTPAILGGRAERYAREADPETARVLRLGMAASVYLFGLGEVGPHSDFVEHGFVTGDVMAALERDGAVGELLGHFIDSRGRIVDGELDDRTLGLGLDDVRDAGIAIAVVSGASTHAVARAVVRSSLCTVLITDEATALAILDDSP